MHYYMVQYRRIDFPLDANDLPMVDAPKVATFCAQVVQVPFPLEYASDIKALELFFLNSRVTAEVISWQALKGLQRPELGQ